MPGNNSAEDAPTSVIASLTGKIVQSVADNIAAATDPVAAENVPAATTPVKSNQNQNVSNEPPAAYRAENDIQNEHEDINTQKKASLSTKYSDLKK